MAMNDGWRRFAAGALSAALLLQGAGAFAHEPDPEGAREPFEAPLLDAPEDPLELAPQLDPTAAPGVSTAKPVKPPKAPRVKKPGRGTAKKIAKGIGKGAWLTLKYAALAAGMIAVTTLSLAAQGLAASGSGGSNSGSSDPGYGSVSLQRPSGGGCNGPACTQLKGLANGTASW